MQDEKHESTRIIKKPLKPTVFMPSHKSSQIVLTKIMWHYLKMKLLYSNVFPNIGPFSPAKMKFLSLSINSQFNLEIFASRAGRIKILPSKIFNFLLNGTIFWVPPAGDEKFVCLKLNCKLMEIEQNLIFGWEKD